MTTKYLAQKTILFGLFTPAFLVLFMWSILETNFWGTPLQSSVILPFYIFLLGMSHFLVSFYIYFDRSNWAEFFRNTKNRALYFGIPLALLASVIIDRYYLASAPNGVAHKVFASVVMSFNFFHVCRQSYGISQLLKRSLSCKSTLPLRPVEHGLFLFMALLLSLFFIDAQFSLSMEEILFVRPFAIVILLFVAILYLKKSFQGEKQNLVVLLYISLHFTALYLTTFSLKYYVIFLAFHYVEYHILIFPRLRQWLKQKRPKLFPIKFLGFYLCVLLVSSYIVWGRHWLAPHLEMDQIFIFSLVHFLAGISLVHFYLDGLIWSRRSFWKKDLHMYN